eukprot:UN09206
MIRHLSAHLLIGKSPPRVNSVERGHHHGVGSIKSGDAFEKLVCMEKCDSRGQNDQWVLGRRSINFDCRPLSILMESARISVEFHSPSRRCDNEDTLKSF